MVKVSPLKGIERDNHKYVKRELVNGKWKYWYKDPKPETDSSQLRTDSQLPGKWTGKTASWIKGYKDIKNRKSSGVVSSPVAESVAKSVGKKVAAGRAAAAKVVKISNEPVKKAQTLGYDPSDAGYKDSMEKVQKELEQNNEKTEKYYNEMFEKEKDNYSKKLMSALVKQYGENVSDEQKARIESMVEEYGKTLWEDVYKPMADQIKKANKQASDRALRVLRKVYDK